MTKAKKLQRLIIVLVTLFLGTSISLLFQIYMLKEEATLYQSVSKLLIKNPISQAESGKYWKSQTKDFYQNVIEALVSEEIKRRAMVKAFAMTPGLTSCEVHIQVNQLNESGVFEVAASSAEPDFTRVFLDTLMEEFIAFQTGATEELSEKLNEIVIQARASPPVKVIGDWQEAAFSGAMTGGVAGLIAGLLLAFSLVRPEKEISINSSNVPLSPEQSPAKNMRSNAPSVIANNRLLIWGLVIGAALGLLIQVLRLASRPQEFRSLAMVVAAQGLDPLKIARHQINDDYYGTIIETLESSQLNSAAAKRVRVQNPEIKGHDVDVRVAQTRGSAIFNVLATSNEPKYTKLFLDALLDEFMILRTRQAEKAGLDSRNDVAIQERATPASENVEDWSMPLLAGTALGTWLGGLLGFLAKIFFRSRPEPI